MSQLREPEWRLAVQTLSEVCEYEPPISEGSPVTELSAQGEAIAGVYALERRIVHLDAEHVADLMSLQRGAQDKI